MTHNAFMIYLWVLAYKTSIEKTIRILEPNEFYHLNSKGREFLYFLKKYKL